MLQDKDSCYNALKKIYQRNFAQQKLEELIKFSKIDEEQVEKNNGFSGN